MWQEAEGVEADEEGGKAERTGKVLWFWRQRCSRVCARVLRFARCLVDSAQRMRWCDARSVTRRQRRWMAAKRSAKGGGSATCLSCADVECSTGLYSRTCFRIETEPTSNGIMEERMKPPSENNNHQNGTRTQELNFSRSKM